MRIDLEDLRRHYASLSDEELDALDRADLVEAAQKIYDEELARRGAVQPEDAAGSPGPFAPEPSEEAMFESEEDAGPPPWLPDAVCAYGFRVNRRHPDTSGVAETCTAFRQARIPCYLAMEPADEDGVDNYNVMVPAGAALNAYAVLDRDIINPQREEFWRSHLEALSSTDLVKLDPQVFCAGFADAAARLRTAYEDELARRNLKPRK